MTNRNDDQRNGVIDRRSFLAAGLAGGAMAAVPLSASAACNEVVVGTKQGRLRGRGVGNVFEFRGVRYAEPQTAANRFRAPLPLKPWKGVRDALENGFMANQIPTRGGLWVLSFRDYTPKSEDCLTLNVYTPSIKGSGKRAVMFWCHGGGFATGSGNVPVYDGKSLAEHGDVVVVTVNHRLNTFGYAALQELGGDEFADAGNAGVLDIVAALRWVRDNIAEFGGDPDNVTIFGESGGGAKVSILLGMPAASGLFHKAIVQSGSLLRQRTSEQATATAHKLLDACGLSGAEAAKLRDVPADELMKKVAPFYREFAPVVDGTHIPRHTFDPDATPLAKSIPMLIGTNETESTTFAPEAMWNLDEASLAPVLARLLGDNAAAAIDAYRGRYPDESASRLYFRISSDFMFRRSAITQAERKLDQDGAPVFMYFLAYPSPVDGGRWLTPHAMDLPLMFRNQRLEQMVDVIGSGPDQDRLADQMSSAWIAFAKTGNPSNSVTGTWDHYDRESRNTMVFDTDTRQVGDPDSEDRKTFMSMPAPSWP